MTNNVTISAGIASRYATALFELAKDSGSLDSLDSDIAVLRGILSTGGDFRALIASPIYSRDEMQSAVSAIARRAELGVLMSNTLALMASKRRLFVLPGMLDRLEALLDDHRGIITAEVVAAEELSGDELAGLKETLRRASGRDIRFEITVDAGVIGGVSAKLGSRLVDATVKTKLSNLRNALREVG
ncbi:MAG: ATP synthase F1 subunit delta [Rhodobacteraceae bacterium]|nr:ATP synthase F1 subunit delta [Paracoccaceae bacterium]